MMSLDPRKSDLDDARCLQAIVSAFEFMDQGISIMDGDLKLIAFNSRFLDLLEFPAELVSLGDSVDKLFRYNAERGDYGPGDVEEQVATQMALALRMEPLHFERVRPDGTIIEVTGNPLSGGGYIITYKDVTDRTRSASLAKDAVSQLNCYRQAMDNHLGVAVSDTNGKFLHVNALFARQCGYAQTDLIGKSFRVLKSRHHSPAFFADMWETISSGGFWSGEIRNVRKDGSYFWVDQTIVPFKNENGEIDKYVCVSSDITERKIAEETLKHSEERFRAIAHALPLPFVIMDIAAERTIFANLAFRRLNENQTGPAMSPLADLFTNETDRERFHGTLQRTGRVRDYETRLKGRGGGTIWAVLSAEIMRIGSEPGIFLTVQDISIRKRVENAVREREKRLQGIMDAVGTGILTLNESLRVETANTAAELLFQRSKDDLEGVEVATLFSDSALFESGRLETVKQEAAEIDIKTVEVTGQRKDGTTFPAEIAVRDLLLKKHRLSLLVVSDLTSRKAADAEKAQMEKTLRQSQKMEALGTLAGGVAHDINNSLVPVIGLAELAIETMDEEIALKSDLQDILDAGNHIRKLVEQILAYSRQEDPKSETIDLAATVRETLKLLRSTIPSSIGIVDRLDDRELPITGDDTQIHQALVNLFVNAADAMADDTGRIEISVERRPLDAGECPEIEIGRDGEFAVLSVRDSGGGMDAETQARIFDPFFTTKDVGEGTGLGLAVVHGIVSGHGGAVRADSVLGEGTTFHLYFPLLPGDEEVRDRRPNDPDNRPVGASVLNA